jgi:hypothetical protein
MWSAAFLKKKYIRSPEVRQNAYSSPEFVRRSDQGRDLMASRSDTLKVGVLRLQPCPRPTAHVARTDALRDDALKPHVTGVPEDRVAVSGGRSLTWMPSPMVLFFRESSMARFCAPPATQGARRGHPLPSSLAIAALDCCEVPIVALRLIGLASPLGVYQKGEAALAMKRHWP